MKTVQSPFLTLARKSDLDQETAFTICRMIGSVGWELVEDWDWDWLQKKTGEYRSLINPAILDGAWSLLLKKDWYSLQTTNDVDKKISTIAPLEGLANLRTLVLQNNLVEDLQPISEMVELRALLCYSNRISDLSPIQNLQSLEELSLAENPIASFQVLEELRNLRGLGFSAERFSQFAECNRLPRLRKLEITGDGVIESLARLPEMPSLKILSVSGVRNLEGIERFGLLENLSLSDGQFSSLDSLRTLKSLTHLEISTTMPVDLMPLVGLYALRAMVIRSPKIRNKSVLTGLPVLRDILLNDKRVDAEEDVSPWSAEFTTDTETTRPSLELQVVDQQTFDLHDGKIPYGVAAEESNERMLARERAWLVQEISDCLKPRFEDQVDFDLPYMGGMFRSDRLVLYSVAAYESLREILITVQNVLCTTRNNWIVYCQSLLREGPEEQEVPETMEDFIVWVYPDKILATEKNAAIVRKLIAWRQ